MRKIPREAREQIDETIKLLDDLTKKMLEYSNDRSDRWNDSDAGIDYEQWLNAYDEAQGALEALADEPDGDAPIPKSSLPAKVPSKLQQWREQEREKYRRELKAELTKEIEDLMKANWTQQKENSLRLGIRPEIEESIRDEKREFLERQEESVFVRRYWNAWYERLHEAQKELVQKKGLVKGPVKPTRPKL